MTQLDFAKRYTRLGWKVLPLEPGGKEPLVQLVPNAVMNASADMRVLHEWRRRFPRANVGVKCEAFLVVDIDVRHGGDAQMAEWVALYGRLPVTPVARTGGGGYHYLFQPVEWERRGHIGRQNDDQSWPIDILQGNRFIVAEPSVTVDCVDGKGRTKKGGPYRWLRPPWTCPLAPLPAWLATLIRREPANPPSRPAGASSSAPDVDARIRRARAYLVNAEGAVSGQNGSTRTFVLAQHVARGFCLDEQAAFEAMTDWNARCDPPWSERDLRRKIRQAIERGDMRQGEHLG